jgi:glutathione S-transferase
MTHDLTLWGSGTGRTMRAHWMLLELGLEYEVHPIGSRTGETRSAEFMRLNPRHKIPVLRHGALVLTESAAIVQYLAETFAETKLIYAPHEAASRARMSEWCFFVISELDAASLNIVRRHEGLAHIYGAAPVAIEAARQYFRDNIEAMAARVADGAPYLFGEWLSAADVLLTSCLDWAVAMEIPLSAALADYRHTVVQRPAYRAAWQRNFAGRPAAPSPRTST